MRRTGPCLKKKKKTESGVSYVVQSAEDEVVHLHPDWASPIILALGVMWIGDAQRPDSKRGPEFLRVAEDVEDASEVWGVGREEAEHQGKYGDVTLRTMKSFT
jgi:hypothetical protein